MKDAVSSLDVFVLASELQGLLGKGRLDKVYQIADRMLKVRFHVAGEGKRELVVAPHYVCVSRYVRPVPEQPTSFAMQLRKHLSGAYLRDVRQHGFDRILEFDFEGSSGKKTLVVELFHHGNVVLVDEGRKILGLLEWQKWRDRVLGVGKTYEHPPARMNPLTVERREVEEILAASDKGIVRMLASQLGWPPVAAEEICALAGVEKEATYPKLSVKEQEGVLDSFLAFRSRLQEDEPSVRVVLDGNGAMVDVVPYTLKVFEGKPVRDYPSLNDALDDYFAKTESEDKREAGEKRFEEERERLATMRESQRDLVGDLERKSEEYQAAGDRIYQHMADIEDITQAIEEARSKGLRDEDILATFKKGAKEGMAAAALVKDLKREKLILEL